MLSCNVRFIYVKKKNVNEFQIYYRKSSIKPSPLFQGKEVNNPPLPTPNYSSQIIDRGY